MEERNIFIFVAQKLGERRNFFIQYMSMWWLLVCWYDNEKMDSLEIHWNVHIDLEYRKTRFDSDRNVSTSFEIIKK